MKHLTTIVKTVGSSLIIPFTTHGKELPAGLSPEAEAAAATKCLLI